MTPSETVQRAGDLSRLETHSLRFVPSNKTMASDGGALCFRPAQVEEDAIRQFGRFLRRIRVTATADDFTTQEEVEELVRQLTLVESSGIFSPLARPRKGIDTTGIVTRTTRATTSPPRTNRHPGDR